MVKWNIRLFEDGGLGLFRELTVVLSVVAAGLLVLGLVAQVHGILLLKHRFSSIFALTLKGAGILLFLVVVKLTTLSPIAISLIFLGSFPILLGSVLLARKYRLR